VTRVGIGFFKVEREDTVANRHVDDPHTQPDANRIASAWDTGQGYHVVGREFFTD
jgi:hypothetical protein